MLYGWHVVWLDVGSIACNKQKVITMWTVTCEMVRGVLEYHVEHSETGERKGTFDCEKWAEEFAAFLNGKDAS